MLKTVLCPLNSRWGWGGTMHVRIRENLWTDKPIPEPV